MAELYVFPYQWILESVTRESALQILSPDDYEKYTRFRFIEDKNRFLAARVFLFAWCKKEGMVSDTFLSLDYSPLGKPSLNTEIEFNWSHSGELIALYIGDEVCGIDVEWIHEHAHLDYASLCSPLEKAWLEEQSLRSGVPEKEWFFSLWTAKESVLKAQGLGLSKDPRHTEIKHEDKNPAKWICGRNKLMYGTSNFLSHNGQNYYLSWCSAQKQTLKPIFDMYLTKQFSIYI